MRKSLLILSLLGLSLGSVFAQKVEKTVSVVPGGIKKVLIYQEEQSVTHLTLTGQMDARDFQRMRDHMPKLEVLDLSKVSIVAYSGTNATEGQLTSKASYKANTIPQNAFYKSTNGTGKRTIKEVIFPQNLTGIGNQAFYACGSLETVVITANVKEIGEEAFSKCPKLTSITAENPKANQKLGKGVFLGVDPSSCTLYVPGGSEEAYKGAKQWDQFFNIEAIKGSEPEPEPIVEAPAPPADSDGDGIPDDIDQCNNTPLAAIGKIDAKGCPLDSDGDGIFDFADDCPNDAGVPSNGGCPEVKEEVKQVFEKALTGIEFESGKDVIKVSSNEILDEIAKIMTDNPSYTLLINGHTDNLGDRNANMILSEKRANAVKFYLLGKGIDSHRMIASGYGDTRPVADNTTDAGRAKNRRVEFIAKVTN